MLFIYILTYFPF